MSPERAGRALVGGRATVFAVGGTFALGGVIALVTFLRDPVSIRPICAFGDGIAYCNAAQGEAVPRAFSRRPVVPAIAGQLPLSLGTAFRVIAVVSLAITLAMAVILANRIARRLGVSDRASRVVMAALIVGTLLACPHGLRLAWSVPVLVDQSSLAAGLLWLVLFTSPNDRVCRLSVPAAFLAGCTREMWGPAIVVTALAVLVVRRKPALAGANAAAATAAYLTVAYLVPTVDNRYSELDVIRYSWHQNFADVDALRHTTWDVLFAAGLMPFVLVLRPPLRWLRGELGQRDVTGAAALFIGLLLLGSALITGSDVTRYLYPAGVVLATISVPWLVAHRELWAPAIALAVATLIVWDPAHHLIATEADYLRYYYGGPVGIGEITPPTPRTTTALIVSAAAVAVALAISATLSIRKRSGPPIASTG